MSDALYSTRDPRKLANYVRAGYPDVKVIQEAADTIEALTVLVDRHRAEYVGTFVEFIEANRRNAKAALLDFEAGEDV